MRAPLRKRDVPWRLERGVGAGEPESPLEEALLLLTGVWVLPCPQRREGAGSSEEVMPEGGLSLRSHWAVKALGLVGQL